MKFDISFNLLGLPWPFEIEITPRAYDLVAEAIRMSHSKLDAIKCLRNIWPEDYLSLRDAKNMIDKAWRL